MDRTEIRFDVQTASAAAASSRQVKAKGNPKAGARKGKRSKDVVVKPADATAIDRARRVEFEALSVSIREELAPKGSIETIYVDRAILAAWKLREAVAAERAGILGGLTIGGDSDDLFANLAEELRRQTDRAERSLRRVLDSIRDLRTDLTSTWGHSIHVPTPVVLDEADSDADFEPMLGADAASFVLPFGDDAFPYAADSDTDLDFDPAPLPADDEAPLPRWQDRLVFDDAVSERSPVVKGTWITVSQIVTLIVDGYTWADILRSHPELSEDDLRACLTYATDQDSQADGLGFMA